MNTVQYCIVFDKPQIIQGELESAIVKVVGPFKHIYQACDWLTANQIPENGYFIETILTERSS
jgi:hypothetical protein